MSAALESKNAARTMEAQVGLLRKMLDAQEQSAAELLKTMGLGQNLDVVG